jgi:hypothetical protein
MLYGAFSPLGYEARYRLVVDIEVQLPIVRGCASLRCGRPPVDGEILLQIFQKELHGSKQQEY